MHRKPSFVKAILDWGDSNMSEYPWRISSKPYHILVSEMLLRKTRADQVINVYASFIIKFPSIRSLAYARTETIHDEIKTLGLHGRSKWMKGIAKNLYERYGETIPDYQSGLEEVLGSHKKYLINALRCFAFGESVPIFDVNIRRILTRVFSIDFPSDAHKGKFAWHISELLVPGIKAKEYNWTMLDLGRKVCSVKNPKCRVCPLSTICDNGQELLRTVESV